MPTHADNRHYGTFITDSPINIGTQNNVDGVNIGSITAYLPKKHDLSDQLDGAKKAFELNPPVMVDTIKSFSLFLNGQLIKDRGEEQGQGDYYITVNRAKVVLSDDFNPVPNVGDLLIAFYVESQDLQ
tara:strand:+ start:879 stop:1262 length:384 start_codon:yes stop_codon:yes gene_type:complete